ncbi:MAG: hypothetical protein A2275_10485 [Bacteroidetes bacterium RIFOXYA12_FULL_35_11]|nr:MAG: hypothetical protein A2X01_11695 [Bacteroidetes bacterium GWF2_35_48]OFY79860.1 MAG: hypothetical protein A2275_10485 [Bacteroidetes bacterium RIFOXYA12_FULL_35_11]OFZ06556.1 MAG: hypothetical protein A2491_10645 [Bacteroidetes bacterium RIFOXYC12_FULL_35_7]
MQFNLVYHIADSLIAKFLNKNEYTTDDLKSIKTSDERIGASQRFLIGTINSGFSKESHKELTLDMTEKYLYHLNFDFNPREIIGDDPETNADSLYGNNDVAGPRADHGTFVAGIIAAVRNNNIGCDGVAENAKIMALRVVPNGDERDKDVANAIRYAVDNGAKIINLSFGKDFSPQKELVDRALKYAGQKNVLVVHAAGNEGDNNDVEIRYPTNRDSQNKPLLQSWLDVGASSMKKGKNFPGFFSNYGKINVDLFAPGVDVFSLTPGSKYSVKSGTSFAAPVVSGVAALIMGAYPDLSADAVRDILLKSVQKYNKKVFLPSIKDKKSKKVKFENLSVTGGVVNAWNALKIAASYKK